MKKLFCFLMSILMIASCLTLVAPAEESEEIARVAVTDGSTIEGWSNNSSANSGIPAPAINTEIDDQGYGAVAVTLVGEIYANGGYKHPDGDGKEPTNGLKMAYQVAKDTVKGVESYDLSGMNYLAFDLYVSNAAVMNAVEVYLELTSSGKSDVQERSWKRPLTQLKGSPLTDGWNHFEIALNSNTFEQDPGLNMTAWNFFRLYNGTAFNAGEGLTVGIKNLCFVASSSTQDDEPAADPYVPVDGVITLPLSGWLDHVNEKLPAATTKVGLGESAEAAWAIDYTGTVFKNGGHGAPEGATGWKVAYHADKPVDISDANYLVLDFYVSKAAYLDGIHFQIELNSHPTHKIDTEENNLTIAFADACGGKLVDGWNRMEIPLDAFKPGMGTDGVPMDATRWTSLRLYTTDIIELGGNTLTVAYKNFGFAENGSGVSGGEDNAQVAAAAEEIIALYEAISKITVGKVNASNYETVKAQLDAAIKAYNAADTAVQYAVDEALSIAKIERAVGRALEQYENEADAPTDPADPKDPVTPADPAEPDEGADEDKTPLDPMVIIAVAEGVVILGLIAALIVVSKKKK